MSSLALASALLLLQPATPPPADSAAPSSAQKAPTAESVRTLVVVRVDLPGGEEIAASMTDAVVEWLSDAEVEITLPGGLPLEIVIGPDPAEAGAYIVTYLHGGDPQRSWSCACTGDEMRFRVGRDSVSVWKRLNAKAEPEPESPAADGPQPVDPSAAATVELDRYERLRFGGSIATLVGSGILLTGGALLVATHIGDNRLSPAGLAVTSVGGVGVAVGVPLWVIGKRRIQNTSLSWVPPWRGRGGVVTLVGRF